ncbi:ankyrin and het domain-containing protein [Colletotrichum kahawae]|uniref:Ankyrin and het domain-containing protein n=1 Tax=Colletotrichum kahawae TaxID=34407 RepID=A0AAD9XWK3_COLKA|nr:ankyrin and het domain-containing protein [Colletotrichum kahawae]
MADGNSPANQPADPSDLDPDSYELQIALDQLSAGNTEALKIYLARKEGADPNTVSIRSAPWSAKDQENGRYSFIGKMDGVRPPGEDDATLKRAPRVIFEDSTIQFEYMPLDPEKRQFRLLRLAPPSEDGVVSQLQLETFSLDDAPPYFCLSYVWGDSKRFIGINCNGKMISVTGNLFHAIQTCLNRHPDAWLWADGICINQDDLAERSSQVLFMGAIYRNASMILAHPGHYKYALVEPDSGSREQTDVLNDRMGGLGVQDMLNFGVGDEAGEEKVDDSGALQKPGDWRGTTENDAYSSENAQGAISIMTFLTRIWSNNTREKVQSDKDWDKVNLPDPKSEVGQQVWNNLMDFWNQDWYFRTWVLQGVVLAKKVVVLYDTTAISLEAITDFWDMARSHGLPRTLRLGPYADIFNKVMHLSPASSFKVLRDQRHGQDKEADEISSQEATPTQPTIFELLCLSRNNLATDPRDKVYGLLGLTDDAVAQSITPDYSPENTASKVFTEVATEITKTDQVVNLLHHAGIDQDLPDLPSWVPDWTKQSRSTLQSHLCQCMGKSTLQVSILESGDKPKLKVRGAVISRVNQVGGAWKYYSHDNSALTFGGFEFAPEVDLPPFNDEDARNFILTLATNMVEEVAERYADEGADDALVRTMVADCSWQGERIWRRAVQGASEAAEPSSAENDPEYQAKTFASNEFFDAVAAFKRFYARGPESPEDLAAPGIRVHPSGIFVWLLDFDEEVEADLQKRMIPYTVPFQEVQKGRRFALLGTRGPKKPETEQNEGEEEKQESKRKMHYATEELEQHFMATLPWNAEIEDYIVLLEGFRTPFVLRKSKSEDGTGQAEEFQIVGDCYVHGVMDGELLRWADNVEEKLESEYFSTDRRYAVRAPQGFVPFMNFTLV